MRLLPFAGLLLVACGGKVDFDTNGAGGNAAAAGTTGVSSASGIGGSGSTGVAGAGGSSAFAQCPPQLSPLEAYQALENQVCEVVDATCGDGCALTCNCAQTEQGPARWNCLEPPCTFPMPVACPSSPDASALDAIDGQLCGKAGATCGVDVCAEFCVCSGGEDIEPRWLCKMGTCPPP